jgi:hypothetical protein
VRRLVEEVVVQLGCVEQHLLIDCLKINIMQLNFTQCVIV